MRFYFAKMLCVLGLVLSAQWAMALTTVEVVNQDGTVISQATPDNILLHGNGSGTWTVELQWFRDNTIVTSGIYLVNLYTVDDGVMAMRAARAARESNTVRCELGSWDKEAGTVTCENFTLH